MREVLRVFAAAVVCVLLLGSPALAQEAQQPVDEDRQGTVDRDVDRDSGEKIWKGCLRGTEDNYVLTAETGEKFRLHSDKDINEHVGNMVEVKGSIDADRADDDHQRVGVATEAGTEAVKEVNVNDIKTVSAGCPEAGAMGQTESQDSAAAGMAAAQPEPDSQPAAATGQAGEATEQAAAAGQATDPCRPGETTEEHAAHAGVATEEQTAQAGAAVATDEQQEEARVESDVELDEDRTGRVEGEVDRDSGEKIWKGCLRGTEDNYVLTAETGEKFRLHSDKDINEHVGNTVEVKGSIDADRADDDHQRVGVATEAGTEAVKEVNVNDIKTVSAGCAGEEMPQADENE